MANPEHVEKLKEGVRAWNKWSRENVGVSIDLSEVNLSGVDLGGVDLSNANLRHANLSGANLNQASLVRANLTEANLAAATLWFANLYAADLTKANADRADVTEANLTLATMIGTDLRESDLRGTLLIDVNLRNADLTGAIFGAEFIVDAADRKSRNLPTTMAAVDFTGASGLDACKHRGPSFLDHLTIIRSNSLPIAFLRGCGLSDQFIDYIPSLFNQAIQFYSCFISYSTKDQEFADRLHADLQNKGVRCWFAQHNIAGGKKIHEQIDEAIRVHDRLLLVLSTHSMNSEWVKTEIANARRRELKEKRQMLFPISLAPFERVREWKAFDANTGKDSAREIREYFIPDFSDWKNHDSYKAAFDRLIRDLAAKDLSAQA